MKNTSNRKALNGKFIRGKFWWLKSENDFEL